MIEEIESLENHFGLSFDDEKMELQEKDEKYQSYLDSQSYDDDSRYAAYEVNIAKEEEKIKEIFTSLIANK